MLSLIVALCLAVAVFFGTHLRFDVFSAVALALVAGGGTYFFLVRRGRKRVEAVMSEVEKHLGAQRVEPAIKLLESLRPLARWQPFLGASIDGQIGMLRYAHLRDFEGARPFLEKAHPRMWHAWAMLAASHYKKKRFDEMEKAFESAVKRNKKEGTLWSAYAWCEWSRGQRDGAIKVLARAAEACPNDEKIKHQLQALQNGKKLKMSSTSPEWLALHLDRTLPTPPPGGARPRFMPPARRVGAREMRRG